jgi:hypothetical protein
MDKEVLFRLVAVPLAWLLMIGGDSAGPVAGQTARIDPRRLHFLVQVPLCHVTTGRGNNPRERASHGAQLPGTWSQGEGR